MGGYDVFSKTAVSFSGAGVRRDACVVIPCRLDLTLGTHFDILFVRVLADISISVCDYEYLFSKWKGFGG